MDDNYGKAIRDVRERSQRKLVMLDPTKVQAAVEYIRLELAQHEDNIPTLRKWISEDPIGWWATPRGAVGSLFDGLSFAMTGGMAVKNALRKYNLGESGLGVENLDEIYIDIIELAVKE